MADCTILGMPLGAEDDDEITTAQPLSGVVIVKALCADGEIRYLTGATPGLHPVECLGMTEYASLRLRKALAGGTEDTEEES